MSSKTVFFLSQSGATLSYELKEDLQVTEVGCNGVFSADPSLTWASLTAADGVYDDQFISAPGWYQIFVDAILPKGTRVHFAPSAAGSTAFLQLKTPI